MTKEKLKSVLSGYKNCLIEIDAKSVAADYDAKGPTNEEALNHLLSMMPRVSEHLKNDKIGKMFRWLGFIQGVLWMTGQYSLSQLMDHSRPEHKK